ncbi:MAG: DUF4388 domain-containing protein [Acidobacteriota bacterium]
MTVEGTLDVFNLPEILQLVAQQRKTGILTVQGESNIVAISFLQGDVVAADALDRTVEAGLREVLVRDGIATAEALESVELGEGEMRPMDRWVEHGVVTREQVLAGLRKQTFSVLQGLLGWTRGDFKFYSGDEVSFEEGLRPISIEELLVRSIADEEPADVPDKMFEYEGSYRQVPRLGLEVRERVPRVPSPEEIPGVLYLLPDEREVLEHLDRPRSVAALSAATGRDENSVRLALFRVLEMEVVETHEEPDEVASLFDVPAAEASDSLGEDGSLAEPPDPREATAADPGEDTLPHLLPVADAEDSVAEATAAEGRLDVSSEVEELGGEALDDTDLEFDLPLPGDLDATGVKADLPEADLDLTLTGVKAPPRRRFRGLEGWVGRSLGLLLAVLFLLALADSPLRLFAPLDDQREERAVQANARLGAAAVKLDRALKTSYLLSGAFPANAAIPIAGGLVHPADLESGGGLRVLWQVTDSGYDLTLAGTAGGPASTESVVENFYLDPAFVALSDNGATVPLVLLD